MTCPVCGSTKIEMAYPAYSGTCITSDMMVLDNADIRNGMCLSCGLIFNGGGTRRFTGEFYRDFYSLMMRNEQAAIQSFAASAPISQAQRTYQILREMIDLPARGRVLEAGAGKGDFLGYFRADLAEWEYFAFEPSASFDVLAERLPDGHADRCDYPAYRVEPESLDLVVALGVLEHVENPLDMMRWVAASLRPGGYFYLRVPNFPSNPNDLFCVDHLSKLTVPTLRVLGAAAGLEPVVLKEAGVPVFMTLRKAASQQDSVGNAAADNRPVLERNVEVAKSSMGALLSARQRAKETGTKFAIFGLGSSGLFAPFFGDFPLGDITAYVDENRSMWGSSVHGRPVVGLDGIREMNIRHIALAISPVYYKQVAEKLLAFDVEIYAGR